MSNWWWILIGALIFVILFIIYDKRKTIFKKRSKKEKKVVTQKEEKLSKKELNSKIKFEKTEKKNKDDIIVEEAGLVEQEEIKQQNSPRRPVKSPVSPKENLEDDFDEFRKKHSYTRFLGDKNVAEQIKNLSPEMKAILFGNVLDRKDQ